MRKQTRLQAGPVELASQSKQRRSAHGRHNELAIEIECADASA